MDVDKMPDENTKEPVAKRVGKILGKTGLVQPAEDKPSKKGWSIWFLIFAINFGIGGCNVAYSDANVVGGDAYNYVIGAGRGMAVVGVGIVCALISVVFAVYDLTNVIIHYNEKN